MNAGFAYLIQSKELYKKNREEIIKLIECSEGIYNASVIEYNNDLYLIIDGHSSILEVSVYKLEDEDDDGNIISIPWETFSFSLAKLIYPSFLDKVKKLIKKANFQEFLIQHGFLKMGKVIMKRRELFYGLPYGEINGELSLMFNTSMEKLESLSNTIFKSTTEKTSVSPITFIETLFDMLD